MSQSDKRIVNSMSRSEWTVHINEWVHNETDREMIRRSLLDGASIETIAEEQNLSAVQTQKRLKRAKEQLFKHV